MSAPSQNRHPLDSARLIDLLGEAWPKVVVTEQTESTNRDLVSDAIAGAPAWALHTTDHQVAGRGRLDRSFVIPDQAGVALSVLIRPESVAPVAWTWLPLVAGIAASDALRELGLDAVLKWPNDVLTTAQKKLAGILVERIETPTGPVAIIGIGINVSLTPDELPTETATSLQLEGIDDVDRHRIVVVVAQSIRSWVQRWEAGESDLIAQAYLDRCITVGQEVRILRAGHEDVVGQAEGIDAYGCLIVDGQSWSAGDVQHVRAIWAD